MSSPVTKPAQRLSRESSSDIFTKLEILLVVFVSV